ncbi:Rpn family recombination-promoting nuclease/putative transposase [Dolichospermum sp. ST_sed3]|nr:Rpn family recombination-promoting nuclease/putative transposase [Dolichospermum sp. WA123]MDD1444310.1 Rpn family recombination-promoting nuclease/putative transposase [Dolichospermum sp. ST_sed3]MDK2459673.1 Rpn family recombination-promoting nuclease/putative transposase [Aphanizomenon sp. PH219]MDM3856551.1 Rpn family recombination-promoting nuclease/putative transposase [Aphanizomenon gracile PMC649.10]MDM3862867.1 Rpn family recombination-promoting nuclease/putative transposase [Aphani
MSFDNVCKLLAEKYPLDFARWLLPEEPQSVKVLKTELSIEPIRADFVTFLKSENQILHIEFQTLSTSRKPIPLRVIDYYIRLKRLYTECTIIQVVIFLQETEDKNAFINVYQDVNTTHYYQVIRMWEQDPVLFLNNPALLPLAPLTRTNAPQDLLSQVAESVAKIEEIEIKRDIVACTEILAGLRFEKKLISQLLREDIMRESVIYQDILQKGEEKGRKEGEKRGEQQGEQRTIIRQLNRRFGELDSSLVDRIKTLNIEKLDNLADALLDFSNINNLVNWLNDNQDEGQ